MRAIRILVVAVSLAALLVGASTAAAGPKLTPSGNVGCADGSVRCDIGRSAWTTEKPRGCDGFFISTERYRLF